MAQSHNCAYLVSPGDQCRCDEPCQYMLTTYNRPCGPIICGKDQLTGHFRENDPQVTSKDEPELWICPNSGKVLGCNGCGHAEPHRKDGYCHLGERSGDCLHCIPYKKELIISQEPDRPCQACIEGLTSPCGKPLPGCPYEEPDQIDMQQAHTAQIDALTERVDAAVRELSDARQKVAASKEVIRENIELKEALAEMQVKFQKEREAHATTRWVKERMGQDYIGKLDELHRSFETVAQALEDGRVKCAGLEKKNAAIGAALKAVL